MAIRSVMAAPDTPVAIVVLRASGKKEEIVADQRKLGEILGGTPTVVGAVNALDVQAVARRDNKGKPNPFKLPESFEAKLRGDVVLFRTADDAVRPRASRQPAQSCSRNPPGLLRHLTTCSLRGAVAASVHRRQL